MTAREAMPAELELEPCPLCGNNDVRLNQPSEYHRYGCINCPACELVLPGAVGDLNELIDCWNTRPASQPAPATVVGREEIARIIAMNLICELKIENGAAKAFWQVLPAADAILALLSPPSIPSEDRGGDDAQR